MSLEEPDPIDDRAAGPAAARSDVALDKAVLYLTWLVPVLETFPRSQRFLLGDRLQTLALRTVEDLVEARYSKAPTPVLRRVNIGLEQQRVLVLRRVQPEAPGRAALRVRGAQARRHRPQRGRLDQADGVGASVIHRGCGYGAPHRGG